MHNLVSFAGIFVLMGLAWLLSSDRRTIHWRAVFWGTALQLLFGYLFYPLTLVIGVPVYDAVEVSRLIGERTILTEVKAYQDLAAALAAGAIHSPRSAVIAAYALCGFAHVASLAIFVGGTAALVPRRTRDLSAIGPRALAAATLACLMTAAVAGTFYTGNSVLFGK